MVNFTCRFEVLEETCVSIRSLAYTDESTIDGLLWKASPIWKAYRAQQMTCRWGGELQNDSVCLSLSRIFGCFSACLDMFLRQTETKASVLLKTKLYSKVASQTGNEEAVPIASTWLRGGLKRHLCRGGCFGVFKIKSFRASKEAEQARTLAAKPGDLSSSSRIHMVEAENKCL